MSALPKRKEYYTPLPRRELKAKNNPMLSYLVGIVIMGIILAFMSIAQYATVVQADGNIMEIKKKIEVLKKENEVLGREIINFKSCRNMRKIAESDLGMIMPEEKDVVILNE